MTAQKYGQNHDEVVRFIEQIKAMTPEQIKTAAADAYASAAAADAYASAAAAADADAADDASAADDAYADASADAAYEYRWYFGRAAFALAIRHLIGKHGFTEAHYDLLTVTVRLLESFQVKPELPSIRLLVLYQEKLQNALAHRKTHPETYFDYCNICSPIFKVEDVLVIVDAILNKNALQ